MDKRDQVVRSQVNKPLSDRVGSRLRHKKGIKGTVWSKHHKTSEKDWNSDISWTTLWGLITYTSHKHQGQLAACQRELATCGLLWTLLEDHVPLFKLTKHNLLCFNFQLVPFAAIGWPCSTSLLERSLLAFRVQCPSRNLFLNRQPSLERFC